MPPPPPSPASTPVGEAIPVSGDEYKMYFESTEKVVDRRLALNSWNYGICIAIIVACGVISNLALSQTAFRLALFSFIALLCLMGILLCTLWLNQIKDYKALNDAKFGVLNDMAPHVRFADAGKSFEPFMKEWALLSNRKATIHKAGFRHKVLKASNAELIVPRAFMGLFGGIAVVIGIAGVVNFDVLLKDPLSLPAEKAGSASTPK